MKKLSIFLMFLLGVSVIKLCFAGEPAVYDPRNWPSILGEYNGETKRIKATADGKLKVETSGTSDVSGSTVVVQKIIDSLPAGTNLIGAVNSWQAGNWTVSDERYASKISTYTAGKLVNSGSISVDYPVNKFSFLVLGGEAQITSSIGDGVMYLADKMGNETVLDIPRQNVSFSVSLTNGATVYYVVSGIK